MKYAKGDKVKIREDLEVGKWYGRYEIGEKKSSYRGRSAEIVRVGANWYVLDIDCGSYAWSDEMLEPISVEVSKDYIDRLYELVKDLKDTEGGEKDIIFFSKLNYLFGYIEGLKEKR